MPSSPARCVAALGCSSAVPALDELPDPYDRMRDSRIERLRIAEAASTASAAAGSQISSRHAGRGSRSAARRARATENHCASIPYTSRSVGGVSAASGAPSATTRPSMEHDDAIGDARSQREIVDRQHDAAAVPRERAQQVRSFELMRRVEPRERLVGQDPFGFAGQYAREQHTCRSPPESVVTVRCDHCVAARHLHRALHGCFVLRIAGAMPGTECGRAPTSVATSIGHAISGSLRQEGDAPCALAAAQRVQRACRPDRQLRATGGATGHAREQRGLAGAVRAEHGGDAARLRTARRPNRESGARAALERQVCDAVWIVFM